MAGFRFPKNCIEESVSPKRINNESGFLSIVMGYGRVVCDEQVKDVKGWWLRATFTLTPCPSPSGRGVSKSCRILSDAPEPLIHREFEGMECGLPYKDRAGRLT